MNSLRKPLSVFLLAMTVFLFSPMFVFAQGETGDASGVVGLTYQCHHDQPGDCTFEDVIKEVQNVTKFAVEFALGFSIVVLAFAGFKYMISGENANKRKEANKMLLNVVIGILVVLSAWLIVTLITGALLNPGYSGWLG